MKKLTIKYYFMLTVALMCTMHFFQSCNQESSQVRNSIIIGETAKIFSKQLNREIIADIYLPEGYSGNLSRYPVLFTCQSSFLHVSGITNDLERKNEIPEMIVVSIRNYSSADFIPEKSEGQTLSGNADKFILFFKEEMIPFIDSNYRTHPFRVFYSGSFGGGFSVYATLTHPDVFNACVASTPAIDFEGDNTFIMKNAETLLNSNSFENNFLYMGVENEPMLLPVLETFVDLLAKKKLPEFRFEYHKFFDEDHGSLPNKVIYNGLRFVFSSWNNIPNEVAGQSIDKIREYLAKLKKIYDFEIGISDMAIHRALRTYRNEKNISKEIELLKLDLEFNPESEMMWLTLGRAYEKAGQLDLAKTTFDTAYQKAVKNSSAHIRVFTEALERVKKK